MVLVSVFDHVVVDEVVEDDRFSLNRGFTKVRKASRILAESMAEVSM